MRIAFGNNGGRGPQVAGRSPQASPDRGGGLKGRRGCFKFKVIILANRICVSGRPTWAPLQKKAVAHATALFLFWSG